MKLNNKGFAISSIMYLILIMAILLISIILTLLGNRKVVLDKLKDNVKAEVYKDTTDLEFNRLYKRLDYIESTGTQYIDTGYSLTSNNEKVYIDYEKTSTANDESLFGSEYSSQGTTSTRIFTLILYGGETTYIFGGAGSNGSITTTLNQRYQTELEAKDLKITGTHKNVYSNTVQNIDISYAVTNGDLSQNPSTIILFGNNLYTGSPWQFVSAKVYSFKLWDDGILVRNMIPCYRKSDNAVGMYDTVNGVFYTNKGTGVFIKGTESDFNRQYQELKYIQSSGTQYIDTGYYSMPLYESLELKYQFLNSTKNEMILATGYTSGIYEWWYQYQAAGIFAIYSSNGTQGGVTVYKPQDTAIHTVKRDKLNVYLNNTLAISFPNGTYFPNIHSYPVYLFGGKGGYLSTARLWHARFINDNGKIYNLIPCYRKSDGEVGLYDTVSKQFFINSGTGSFIKGPEKGNYFDPSYILQTLNYGNAAYNADGSITFNRTSSYFVETGTISLSDLGMTVGNKYYYTFDIDTTYTTNELQTTVLYYDSSKAFISEESFTGKSSKSFKFTIPANTAYLVFRFNRTYPDTTPFTATYKNIKIYKAQS